MNIKKSQEIKIRVSKSEKEKIKTQAENLGMTMSNFLRKISQEDSPKFEKIVIKKADPKLIFQLKKIGVNFNQVVKNLNKARNLNLDFDLNELNQNLNNFINELKRLKK